MNSRFSGGYNRGPAHRLKNMPGIDATDLDGSDTDSEPSVTTNAPL
jgi:hypothetical protein